MDSKKRTGLRKTARVIVITNADSLEHLPTTKPLSIEELFENIDSAIQLKYPDLCSQIVPQLKIAIAKSKLSIDCLAYKSQVNPSILNALCTSEQLPDIDQLSRICPNIGLHLKLNLVSRKEGKKLSCDAYLSNSKALESHLRERLPDLQIHWLANKVFQHCGLEKAPGLDGGDLEDRIPILFRLMRQAMFMRCNLALEVLPTLAKETLASASINAA